MLALTLCLFTALSLLAAASRRAATATAIPAAAQRRRGRLEQRLSRAQDGQRSGQRRRHLRGSARRYPLRHCQALPGGRAHAIQLNGLVEAGRIVTGQTRTPLRSADAGMDAQTARHVAVAVQAPLVADPAALRQHVVQRRNRHRIATKYGIRPMTSPRPMVSMPVGRPSGAGAAHSDAPADFHRADPVDGAGRRRRSTVTAPTFGQAPGFVPPIPSPRPPAPTNQPCA